MPGQSRRARSGPIPSTCGTGSTRQVILSSESWMRNQLRTRMGGKSPLDFLLGVMSDPTATPRQRVKAAGVAARYKHAYASGPEAPSFVVVEDKFGFKVAPELARAERDDLLREQMLHENWYRREKGSEEEKAADQELAQIRKRRTERLALLQYPQGYTVDDVAKDRKRLEQLRKARFERKKLTPEEDAEEAHLAARVTSYQLNPAVLAKPRIRDLEERRAVGFELSSAEEAELKDLRGRYPELAAEIDELDLLYLYEFGRELEIAHRAGLGLRAASKQAEMVCLRFRDPSKFTSELRAALFRPARRGKGTPGAS
jgi:hypothetical protein